MKKSDKRQKILIFLTGFAVVAAMSGLVVRLVVLQAYRSEKDVAALVERRIVQEELIVGRGKILDRNSNILAMDLLKTEVCADPFWISKLSCFQEVAGQLSGILAVDQSEIAERFSRNPNSRFVRVTGYGNYVSLDIADELRTAIRDRRLSGIILKEAMVRSYTMGSTMSQVLGFVNFNGDGTFGIEQRFDSYLKGEPGILISERDGRRRELYDRRSMHVMPRPGADIFLTIDNYIQHVTERALISAVEEQGALGGWAIVQRVRTGEILAMVGYPSFDPQHFRTEERDTFRNRCVAEVFEPGSTFKVSVIAAALNEGLIGPDDKFDCENGMWFYGGRPLRDYRPHGILSVADIVQKSSNIGSAKIALELGNRRLFQYLRAFGAGRVTGVDLPGEEAGILHHPSRWSAISATRIAMGHEVAVTALQMLNMVCAIANGGELMRPYIVDRVVDGDGSVLYHSTPRVLGRPVTPQTAAVMRRLLTRVTEAGGTGRRAYIEGYKVAGKTGTAQKPIPGGYSDRMNISSFVGFVPAHDPELGMIVVLDSPQKSRTGGGSAAPVFKDVMTPVLRYCDVPESSVRVAVYNDARRQRL